MQDLLVLRGEAGQSHSEATQLLLLDEATQGVFEGLAPTEGGDRVQRDAALATPQRVGNHVAGDPPDERPQIPGVPEPPALQCLEGPHQRFLDNLVRGLPVTESAEGHDLQPGPQLFDPFLRFRPVREYHDCLPRPESGARGDAAKSAGW